MMRHSRTTAKTLREAKEVDLDLLDLKGKVWGIVTGRGADGRSYYHGGRSGWEAHFQFPASHTPGYPNGVMEWPPGMGKEGPATKKDINAQHAIAKKEVSNIIKVYKSKANKHPETGEFLNKIEDVAAGVQGSARAAANITRQQQYASLLGSKLPSSGDYESTLKAAHTALKKALKDEKKKPLKESRMRRRTLRESADPETQFAKIVGKIDKNRGVDSHDYNYEETDEDGGMIFTHVDGAGKEVRALAAMLNSSGHEAELIDFDGVNALWLVVNDTLSESRENSEITMLAESVGRFLVESDEEELDLEEVIDWISGYYANMNKNSRKQMTSNLAKFGIDMSGNNETTDMPKGEIKSALSNPAFIKFYNKNS